MFYLGIDQHAKQLTIDLGDEEANLVDHRQVSTEWKPLRRFLSDLALKSADDGGFMAVVEVCGFNRYLIALLYEYGCKQVLLVQPETRSRRKTDRRDARRLRELLWVNRDRFRAGERAPQLRVVRPPSEADEAARQLTALRTRLTRLRTKAVNKVQGLVRKHNLQHDRPTKGTQTKRAIAWMRTLELPEIDRFEMDLQLNRWELYNEQLAVADKLIEEHQQRHEAALLLSSVPGLSLFGSLMVGSRIGNIEDFIRGDSLANYWGLTPGSSSTGDTVRHGHITKEGSPLVRYILGQAVLHVLRKDAWMRKWYQRLKKRRGSGIARVAVMRRLATVIWAMLKYKIPYVCGGPEEVRKQIEWKRNLSESAKSA